MKRSFIWGAWVCLLGFAACTDPDATQTSERGNEYRILSEGEGATPEPGDYVYFHGYAATAEKVLKSSRAMGQTPYVQIPQPGTAPGQEVSPVQDILSLMQVGDSALVLIPISTFAEPPADFAQEEYMYYYIVPYQRMTETEFLAERQREQQRQQHADREQMAATIAREGDVLAFAKNVQEDYQSGTLPNIKNTASGLKYVVHEPGSGQQAQAGNVVKVHYVGMLTDGTIFDQSLKTGRPIQFPLGAGQVIPGWDEGLALLREGAKATFFIPSELAYGQQGRPGRIPGGAELIFYVELENVQ